MEIWFAPASSSTVWLAIGDGLPPPSSWMMEIVARAGLGRFNAKLGRQFRHLGRDLQLVHMEVGDAHAVPGFQAHRLPDADGDVARPPIPAILIRRFARVGRGGHVLFVAFIGGGDRRQNVRQRLDHRNHAGDRRAKDHAQLIRSGLQRRFGVHAPGAKHVVGGQQRLAVQLHLRVGVEAVEDQFDVLARQRGGIHLKSSAVFPVGEPDPLQPRFVVAIERIGNQLGLQQVGLDYTWHRRRMPVRDLRTVGRVQRAKFPAGIDGCEIGCDAHNGITLKTTSKPAASRSQAALTTSSARDGLRC